MKKIALLAIIAFTALSTFAVAQKSNKKDMKKYYLLLPVMINWETQEKKQDFGQKNLLHLIMNY